MSWKQEVIQSITGGGGTIVRKKTGVPNSDTKLSPASVAEKLQVDPTWHDEDYSQYQAKFGADTPKILYQAMFENPSPDVRDAIEANFSTTPDRIQAIMTFIKMTDNLVDPDKPDLVEVKPVEAGPSRSDVSPDLNEVVGSKSDDPVGDFRKALGFPDMSDKRLMAMLLLTHTMPNNAVGVRSYIETKLGVRDFHQPIISKYLEENTPLSMSAWNAVEADVGGFDDLPAELHAWFGLDVPFKTHIGLAMTQPNAFALLDTLLPAPGILGRRAQVDARLALHANFPSLDAWLARTTIPE